MDDLRHALRTLRRSPGFTLVAILTLAAGIGANTAVFSVVDSVLLRPLAFRDADRLVSIQNQVHGKSAFVGVDEIADYQEHSGAFAEVAAFHHFPANLTGGDRPERLPVASVNANYFSLLGVEPAQGRNFAPADAPDGNGTLVIISHALWQRRFAGASDVIGKRIELDDDPYTVIGIMPAGFREPLAPVTQPADLWVPTRFRADPYGKPDRQGPRYLEAFGRLAPGETDGSARAKVGAVAARLRATYPQAYRDPDRWGVVVEPLAARVVGDVGRPLLILCGAVALVLLIACANITILLLARGSARRKEVTVRAALGATRGRIVRQLLAESVVLSLAGGLLGIGIAVWATELLASLAPATLPRAGEVRVDAGVLAFTLGLSVVTALLAGLVPALRASKVDLQSVLVAGGRGGHGRRDSRLRSAFLVAQVALAMIMLVSAGLLLRSLWNAQRVDPGFDARGVVSVDLWLPLPNDLKGPYVEAAPRIAFGDELVRRLKASPGVTDAALASSLPMTASRLYGPSSVAFLIEGRGPQRMMAAAVTVVTPGYFDTLRVPVLSGRAFDVRDVADAPRVVIINRTMADRFWPGEDPVGKRVGFGQPGKEKTSTIVGVVADIKSLGLDAASPDEVFWPIAQNPISIMTIVVRARDGSEAAVARAIPEVVRSIDQRLPTSSVRPLAAVLEDATARRRFLSLLLAAFAAVAVALAALGLYSVMSYVVTLRRHEIGVRLAVGARAGDVLRLVLGHALRVTAAGVVLGVAGAYVAGRALSGMLFGIDPVDPLTYTALAAGLLGVAGLAALLPARRAMRVDPMIVLRAD